MRRAISLLLLATLLGGAILPPVRADVTAEQVRDAIDRAKAYLVRQQQPDGAWRPEYERQPGGVTALCTLALLHAGVEPEEEHVQSALKYLRKIRPERTYVASLQIMVFCKAGLERDRPLVAHRVAWLEKTQLSEGEMRGAWSYPGLGQSGDNSNSQFALLALHEAERFGVEVDGRTWRIAKAYWEQTQNANGSWGYKPGQFGTGSMTCAGIASLVITSDRVQEGSARVDGDQIRCCLEAGSDDSPIRRAMQWLAHNFAVGGNPGAALEGKAHLLYYLYGLERVGRLTAQRFIGAHDWYREGADFLLRMKGGAVSDHWVGALEEDNRLIATSLALLFLSKGRRPILLSKLKHGTGDDWNRHPSDVNNLTRHVESLWKQDMTWQVIDLKAATVEDLLESPVLYFCGRENPTPESAAAQEQVARKLRDYLDRGGFLFAEAYGGGADFDRGFRQLIDERVFPEPEYRLVPLPPGHPIWRTEAMVAAQYVRPLWGVEFGCRTSVVYCPPDASDGDPRPSLSCLWELSGGRRDEPLDPSVQGRIDAGLAIGANVLAYATNRRLKFKDPATPERVNQGAREPFPRGRLYIANLRHTGGCDAAPRALVTLLETAQRELKIRVGLDRRELSIGDDALFDYPLVFMHGRNDFHLTDAERQQLRTYVERGGIVFANAICASRRFADAFRREMDATFPDHPLKPIPKDDPLFTREYGGFDLATVGRRDPQRGSPGEPLRDEVRQVAPELEAIRFGDRYGVLFSPYDLSCALEKHDSLECQGYVREDAARIGLNVLLYSLQQ
ncbi:MAG TPA: DUF4159 domain-containing protein [Thermoguttaceae bacterium]|nr:DUF4159 domain-containing protein [Thermoguttaceae bacterium]